MSLERSLDRMVTEWGGVKFEVVAWKNTGGSILKGAVVEEVQMLLDDHSIKAQAMLSSPAAGPFLERIEVGGRPGSTPGWVFDEAHTPSVPLPRAPV